MIEATNFNSLSVSESGRVSFSGLSSGIDFEAAVDSIIAARQIRADNIETRITDNEAKIVAYKDLRTNLNALKDSLDKLRGAVSFGNTKDIFENKQAFSSTSRSDGLPASAAVNLVSFTVSGAAQTGSHSLEVLRVAKAHKFGTSAANSLTTDLGLAFGGASGSIAGSFDINGTTITVQSSDTLQDLRDRINNANTGTTATKVAASIVSVSTTEHYLVLTADDTGTAVTIDAEVGGVLSSLGISADGGTTFSNELQVAQTARFTADGLLDPDRFESELVTSSSVALSTIATSATYPGSFDIVGTGTATVNFTSTTTLTQLKDLINAENATTGVTATVVADSGGSRLVMSHDSSAAFTLTDTSGLIADLNIDNELVIERASNTIDDLYTGVTVSLFGAEEGTTVSVDIERDLNAIKTQINSFVDAYNALKVFINTQSQVDPATGLKTEDSGTLFGSRTLSDVESKLSGLVGSSVSGVSNAYSVLAQAGVDFIDNNALSDPLLADTLFVDDEKLDAALLNNSTDVRRLFGFDFASSDSRVVMLNFSGATAYSASGYTLNIGNVGSGKEDSAVVNDSTKTLNDAVDSFGATVSGGFDINGTPIAYDITTDTLDSLATAINTAAISGVSASVVTSGVGKALEINSTTTPLTINNDTGDLLALLSLTTSDYVVGQANIGGAADGTDNGTITISSLSQLTATSTSGASGLQLLYTGTAALSGASLNFTTGLASDMYFDIDNMLDTTTGTVENEIDTLTSQNEIAQDRIDDILERLAIQRQNLLDRFIAMELAIATSNRILESITQITKGLESR